MSPVKVRNTRSLIVSKPEPTMIYVSIWTLWQHLDRGFMAPQALRGASLNENPSMLAQGNVQQEGRSIQAGGRSCGRRKSCI